jgi:hypothetical protein
MVYKDDLHRPTSFERIPDSGVLLYCPERPVAATGNG